MGGSKRAKHYDPRPPWPGTIGAVATSLVVVALVANDPTGLAGAIVGTGCVAVGLWRVDERTVTVGVLALLGAVILVGSNRTPGWLLIATVPVILVWAIGGTTLRLGRQIGRAGETLRVELVHSVATLTVVTFAAGSGYLVYRSVSGTQSALAVALLVGSVIAAMVALR